MENEEKIKDVTTDQVHCQWCGKNLMDKKISEVFLDAMLFEWFAYVFCDQQCRDNYIYSK